MNPTSTQTLVKPKLQLCYSFFNPQQGPPSNDIRRRMVSPKNPECPLSQFVGNEKAVSRLSRAAFGALGNQWHLIDQSFALLGPASTGKTTLAKLFAQTVALPFIEIQPKAVKSALDIVLKCNEVLMQCLIDTEAGQVSLELVQKEGSNRLLLPPCIIFIDEVHALPNPIVQALLKATERSDMMLDTGKWVVDCRNVCWMIATTHRGLLFGPFDTRFSKIQLDLYSLEEIAQIIHGANPDWDMELCRVVAKYGGRLPREAKSFAQEMRTEADINAGDWKDIAHRVAIDNNIDEYGMTKQRLTILKALARGPIPKDRLCDYAMCEQSELDRFVLPPLVSSASDQEPLIFVGSRGYCLSTTGVHEMTKRGIAMHNQPMQVV